jgi:hypothetical protein
MMLTQEDISAIKDALKPEFEEMTHTFNKRFVGIETRLDRVEISLQKAHDRLGRIEVFVPVENAYALHDLEARLKKIMDRPE